MIFCALPLTVFAYRGSNIEHFSSIIVLYALQTNGRVSICMVLILVSFFHYITNHKVISQIMADSSDEEQSEYEATVSSIGDSESDSDESMNELDEIARQNAVFEQLKSQRAPFGFENLSSHSNPRKRKHAHAGASKSKVKKKIKSSNLKSATAVKKPASNVNRVGTAAKSSAGNALKSSSASVSAPSANALKSSSASVSAPTANTTKKLGWKPKSTSKTNYIMKYYTLNVDADGNMNAVCNLCSFPVSGKMGNNSNLESHFNYVSA